MYQVICIWQLDMQFRASPCTEYPLKLDNHSLELSVDLRKTNKQTNKHKNQLKQSLSPLQTAETGGPARFSERSLLSQTPLSGALFLHQQLRHLLLTRS